MEQNKIESLQKPIIQLSDLKVSFIHGKKILQAVRGVDLKITEGKTVGIVGESGSGKSVTAFSILQLANTNQQSSGNICYRGNRLNELSPKQLIDFRRGKVGLISQEPSLSFDPIYSIYHCFKEAFSLMNPKISKDEITRKACELLDAVEISNPQQRLQNFPHQFSGGMLQRIMIALSLANEPEILIADEPTTALDVTIQKRIIHLLKKIQKERNLTLIFISHDINLVAEISDRIVVMYGGLILEEGPASEVITESISPYTQQLLKSMPQPGDHYQRAKLHTIEGAVPNPIEPEPGCPFEPRCQIASKPCREAIAPMSNKGEHFFRCIKRS